MKADIDHLMKERNLDLLIISGGEEFNPIRYYMTNGAAITSGYVLKKRNETP